MSDASICGYDDTKSGEPCQLSPTYDDGRCGKHTECDTDERREYVNFRLPVSTHGRLSAHNRDSEYLPATIDRALDALEREQELPAAVREAMRDE